MSALQKEVSKKREHSSPRGRQSQDDKSTDGGRGVALGLEQGPDGGQYRALENELGLNNSRDDEQRLGQELEGGWEKGPVCRLGAAGKRERSGEMSGSNKRVTRGSGVKGKRQETLVEDDDVVFIGAVVHEHKGGGEKMERKVAGAGQDAKVHTLESKKRKNEMVGGCGDARGTGRGSGDIAAAHATLKLALEEKHAVLVEKIAALAKSDAASAAKTAALAQKSAVIAQKDAEIATLEVEFNEQVALRINEQQKVALLRKDCKALERATRHKGKPLKK